jgi:hypothetical protein
MNKEQQCSAITGFGYLQKMVEMLEDKKHPKDSVIELLMSEEDFNNTENFFKNLNGSVSYLRLNSKKIDNNISRIMYAGYRFIIKSKGGCSNV